MKLADFSVRRPVFTTMIFAGLVVLGAYALRFLPIDLMPDITFPGISIITMYPGASPEDVEERVTKIIEDYVSTVPNLKEITSQSLENISAITMRFEWNTNMDEAVNDVRSRIDMAKQWLPDDIENPVIFKFDMSMWPILFYGVQAKESYSKLQDILKDYIADPLKRIPGVAIVTVFGAPEKEIQIRIKPDKLSAYQISVEQIKKAVAASNVNFPAGKLRTGFKTFSIRVPGEFQSLKDIENVVVGYNLTRDFKMAPVLLKDVADVVDTFKEKDTYVRVNGVRGALIMVQKQSGINTVEVVKRVKAEMEKLKKRLPSDVKVFLAIDASKFIKRSVRNLSEAVLIGGLLVVIVVFIFLRQLVGSLIISLTIPFSLITAFIFMYVMGYTINMMSLFSLAIAIGMVVDDAIVVYENIYRFKTNGVPPMRAAVEATSEVGNAVMAATFTVVAVFLPIIFVRGIAGVLFQQLGVITTVVILTSLFTALTLTPMMSSRLLSEGEERRGRLLGNVYYAFERGFIFIENLYTQILAWALRRRAFVIVLFLALFVGSLAAGKFVSTEFMPQEDLGEVRGFVELPLGTRVKKTDEVVQQISKIVKEKVPEAEIFFMRAGPTETGFGAIMGRREGTNTILFGATLVPKARRKRSNKDIAVFLETEVAKTIPWIKNVDFYVEDPVANIAMGSAKAFTIEIYGNDFNTMEDFAKKVKSAISNIPGLQSLTISREKGKPEIWVQVDRWKAGLMGLTTYQIGDVLRTYYAGDAVSKYREKGKEYDIVFVLPPEYRDELSDFSLATFITPLKAWVPLETIAEMKMESGPVVVERKNQQRVIRVEGDIYGRPLGDIVNDAREALKNIPVPAGITYTFGGEVEQQKESFQDLGLAFLLAVLLVYMVMAAQYESLLDPFIIMFSVPFAVTGVIFGLLLTGESLSLITFVGVITLVGIVVKNAIVLVDYTNILIRRGMSMAEAIVQAGRVRLRPVLMTATTTIFGMVPLLVMKREGAETWQPFATSVVSGLLFSTFITLVFVPTLYSVLKRTRRIEEKPEK